MPGLPEGPAYAPLLLPGDLPSLPAGAPYELAVLSATYEVSPQLRRLRRAARRHARFLLVDPRTAHLQFEGYMSMEDYRSLPYGPGRTTLGTLWQPREFAEAGRRRELARSVLGLQVEMGADLLLAPYFLIPDVDHPWLEVAVETAAAAVDLDPDRPLGAAVCVELDAILQQDRRDHLVEAYGSLHLDFIWLTVVDFDEIEAWPDEVRAVLDLARRLAARAPLWLSHAGRTGLVALVEGARGYAAGSYQLESFPRRFFREGLVNLSANTYYDPARLIHLPARLAEAAAATGIADRCRCESCGRRITGMVSRRLVAHALRCRQREIADLTAVPEAARREWLRERFDVALDCNRRTREALADGGAPELPADAFHYLEVLREICGGPEATIPRDDSRDL